MLVIISDLHLTDGTSGETIDEGAFRVFGNRLRDMAYDASWRANRKYRPIEEIHLVLLGDILDLIRSTKWPSEKTDPNFVMPWDEPQQPAFLGQIGRITDAILQRNAGSLSLLKAVDDGKTITLPPATQAGRPAKVSWEPDARDRVPVKVHMHYLVGNHDWFLHLPGAGYDQIRRRVVDAMGLANAPTEPFPHDPNESPKIMELYERHRVFARHGDIYDPFNYEGDRNASSLGDAIVVRLLNRFPMEVATKLGDVLPKSCLDGLKEIDNVRPLLMVPIWVDALLRRGCPSTEDQKTVKGIWDKLADDFLNLDFVRARDYASDLFDSVDKLEWALKFSRGVSLQTAGRLVGWIRDKMRARNGSYYENAFTERAFKSRKARYIVYGHTHRQEIVPLDSSYEDGQVFDQTYLNSGTWRRVHELAQLNPKDQEFLGYHVMTYLAFFTDDERHGRPFESWSGALGIPTS